MATGQGTATINFGAAPGANEASVAVTGQGAISATSKVEAYVMAEASVDHTLQDHTYFQLFATLTCDAPTAGTGFNIYGRSPHKLTGQWTVRWVWAD